jgi:hypothetical protein
MSAVEVHVCPILMRTVLWNDEHCTEKTCTEMTCTEDCPIHELENDKD